METKLPYLPVAAFKHKSTVFETEREALLAAINEVITPGPPGPVCDAIYDRASDLLPLLLRAVAVRSADAAVQLSTHRYDDFVAPPLWPSNPTVVVR